MNSHLRSPTGAPLSKDGSIHITDEIFNTLIPACGVVLAVVGSAVLITKAVMAGKFWHTLGFSIYAFGVIGVFATSALHHGINGSPRTDRILRHIDYLAIFIKIPATFTPACLILLRNRWGWTLLALVWTTALIGLFAKAFVPDLSKKVTTIFYVSLGVIGGAALLPAFNLIHWSAVLLVLLGGVFYLGGVAIYYYEWPNPFRGKFGFHEIWHTCVLLGSASHYLVNLLYLLPY